MIIKRINDLTEKRDGKIKESSAILEKAKTENRELKPEELTSVRNIQTEITNIQETLIAEHRQLALEAEKSPRAGLSDSEKRDLDRFDYNVFVRALVKGTSLDGVEKEMVNEGEKEARDSGLDTIAGFSLPRMLVQRQGVSERIRHRLASQGIERRDMTATGGTGLNQGGLTIQTDKFGILDGLYNALTLTQAGATVLPGLRGNFDWPVWMPPGDPTHKTENANADKLNPTVRQVSFNPKRLPAYVLVSDQLVRQSSDAIETVIERNLDQQMRSLIERFAINGTGMTQQPLGLLNVVGINAVVIGADGGPITWNEVVNLETEVAADNADVGSTCYLGNARTRGKLKKTLKGGSGTDSFMILDDRANNLLNGYRHLWTNNVPSNLTKGTGTNLSAFIFGNFRDLVMAFWGGLQFEYRRDIASAIAGQGAIVIHAYYDTNVLRPESFAAVKDAVTT